MIYSILTYCPPRPLPPAGPTRPPPGPPGLGLHPTHAQTQAGSLWPAVGPTPYTPCYCRLNHTVNLNRRERILGAKEVMF